MIDSKATPSDKFEETQSHTAGCDIINETPPAEVTKTSSVLNKCETPMQLLMEKICNRDNLNQAFRRVIKNKGAAGVDGMATTDLLAWLKDHKDEIVTSLLGESYRPQHVLRVDIPKAQGGIRQLGIPICLDRLIQ